MAYVALKALCKVIGDPETSPGLSKSTTKWAHETREGWNASKTPAAQPDRAVLLGQGGA